MEFLKIEWAVFLIKDTEISPSLSVHLSKQKHTCFGEKKQIFAAVSDIDVLID